MPNILKFIPGWGLVVVIALIWLASGTYQVAPGEAGVVLRFGAWTGVAVGPGLHWHLPWPIERVYKPDVERTRRVEVGFETVRSEPLQYREKPEESLMLTKDENIVDNSFIVQYRVTDPVKFLFNVKNPDEAVKVAAESAMRGVVGSRLIDDILTTEKTAIQEDTKRLLQQLLDKYESGIFVINVQLQDVNPPDEVADAFKDVASAREDRQKLINQSQSYQNDIIPKARGEAEKMIREAEAFKEERIKRAEGDADRFISILEEYQKAPEVNRTRLYLETMELILPKVQIYLIDEKASGGVVPYVPISREGGAGR